VLVSQLANDLAWVEERSHEAYATNYGIVFPREQPLAGRNRLKSAIHRELMLANCFFEESAGWEVPGGKDLSASKSVQFLGWFGTPEPCSPLEYDWYGAYGRKRNANDPYKEVAEYDRTFKEPENYAQVANIHDKQVLYKNCVLT